MSYRKSVARCKHEPSYVRKGIKNFLLPIYVEYLYFRDRGWLLKKHSIDRIDNDGDYTLKNCQFIELLDNMIKANSIYGRWARHYKNCIICGRTNRKHTAKGMCRNCYKRIRRKNMRNSKRR